MIAVIWVVALVAIAIWQLTIAKGRTELAGQPFENEPSIPKTHAENRHQAPTTSTPKQKEIITEPEAAPPHIPVEEVRPTDLDLMQAIVLSEIIAPPLARRTNKPQRR